MKWRWWRRRPENSHDATEAERIAARQYRQAKLQAGQVDRAITAAQATMDSLARESERALRLRGT